MPVMARQSRSCGPCQSFWAIAILVNYCGDGLLNVRLDIQVNSPISSFFFYFVIMIWTTTYSITFVLVDRVVGQTQALVTVVYKMHKERRRKRLVNRKYNVLGQ